MNSYQHEFLLVPFCLVIAHAKSKLPDFAYVFSHHENEQRHEDQIQERALLHVSKQLEVRFPLQQLNAEELHSHALKPENLSLAMVSTKISSALTCFCSHNTHQQQHDPIDHAHMLQPMQECCRLLALQSQEEPNPHVQHPLKYTWRNYVN